MKRKNTLPQRGYLILAEDMPTRHVKEASHRKKHYAPYVPPPRDPEDPDDYELSANCIFTQVKTRSATTQVIIPETGISNLWRAQQLLDWLAHLFTRANPPENTNVNPKLVFDFNEWAELNNALTYDQRYKLRKQVRSSTSLLMSMLIIHRSNKGGELHMRILEAYEKLTDNKDKATIHLGLTYAEHLYTTNWRTSLHKALFALDNKIYPHAYPLGRKLCNQWGAQRFIDNGTNDRLSLAACVRALPDMPTFDEVQSVNRNYYDRIIKPIKTALDILRQKEILTAWDIYTNDGERVTNTLAKLKGAELATAILKFSMPETRNQKERKAKAKQLAKK